MRLLKSTLQAFIDDDCLTMAAALAYYTVFALPPLLFLLLTIVTWGMSLAYDSDQAESKANDLIEEQASEMVGNETVAAQISNMLEQNRQQSGLWWKSLISFLAIAVGATGAMAALQNSLNRAWHVQPAPASSAVKTFLQKRLLSLGLILGLGVLLLISLVISTMFNTVGSQVGGWVGMQESALMVINYAISMVVTLFIFAALLKFMPDAKIGWQEATVGAGITTVLFFIGRYLLSLYLTYSEPAAQLGSAAASLAVLLIWLYYSALVFLLGAEFTQSWAKIYGRKIVPEKGAVRVR
ncbi:YihY/virulence factor BrkB family protein [Planctomycetaceae bacterium SH139]